MQGYIGETVVDIAMSKYKEYGPIDWAIHWLCTRSQVDGDHHKEQVIDEITQILHGTEVVVKVAEWEGGYTEERFSLGVPSDSYKKFVEDYEEDGEYHWATGYN